MGSDAAVVYSSIASTYDEVRPGYPPALYDAVSSRCAIDERSRILEVGAGSGIATREIYDRWRPQLTAVEPSAELCGRLKDRFPGHGNPVVISTMFEKYTSLEKFDFIFSATAFHWIDRKVRYKHAHDLLKKDGMIVLYWNNYSRSDDVIFDEIQSVYTRYYPVKTYNNDIRIIQRKSIEDRKKEIVKSGYFSPVFQKEFLIDHRYSARDYTGLLRTIFKNTKHPESLMKPFYLKIEEVILSHGDRIDLPVLIDLNIAGKISDQISICMTRRTS